MDSWVSPVRQARHYIFLLKSGENGNLHLFFPFFYQISTGGQPAQSETTKVPSRGKAPLLMKQRSLAAPFWAVRAQQGGSSENYPVFSRPRAVWQLPRLWALKGGGPLFRLRARQSVFSCFFLLHPVLCAFVEICRNFFISFPILSLAFSVSLL